MQSTGNSLLKYSGKERFQKDARIFIDWELRRKARYNVHSCLDILPCGSKLIQLCAVLVQVA